MKLASLGLAALTGKYFVMNGPSSDEGSIFDGQGYLSCVYFGPDEPVVSDAKIPVSNYGSVKISDFVGNIATRAFTFLKLVSADKKSGTCNTSILKYKDKVYAAEETSRPMEICFDSDHRIQLRGLSESVMAAHSSSEYNYFSYEPYNDLPLKIDGEPCLWKPPREMPLLMHDCKDIGDYLVFPVMSTSFGNVCSWIAGKENTPFNSFANRFKWLFVDTTDGSYFEINTYKYADVFHIAKIKKSPIAHLVTIWAVHVCDTKEWITTGEKPRIHLYRHFLNLKSKECVTCENTGVSLEFPGVSKDPDVILGTQFPNKLVEFNTMSGDVNLRTLPGNNIREVVYFEDILLYYSHEDENTYLYALDYESLLVKTRIAVPNRNPGFHSLLI